MTDANDVFKELIGYKTDKEFIEKALSLIVFPDSHKAHEDYLALCSQIQNRIHPIIARAYGRGANKKKRLKYLKFLNDIFGHNNIKEDPKNNAKPNERFYTTLNATKDNYKNYKLSHIWDRTSKNPYAFCAV